MVVKKKSNYCKCKICYCTLKNLKPSNITLWPIFECLRLQQYTTWEKFKKFQKKPPVGYMIIVTIVIVIIIIIMILNLVFFFSSQFILRGVTEIYFGGSSARHHPRPASADQSA